jgi:O-antigen/teichoic acid export membrane protein
MQSLLQRTFAALGWHGATQALTQAIQFGVSIVLANLLGPHEFGLVGMIWVFTGFASVLADMGLGAAVIQRRELSQGHLNSAFWINVGMASLLTVGFMAAAPLVAGFYREPKLGLITAVLSFNFLLTALSIVQLSLLDRSLNFRTKFWIEMVAGVGSGIVAVLLALSGAGVWSLVSQSLLSSVTRLVVTWHLSTWRPEWSFDRHASKELFRFSGNLIGSLTIGYWGRNIDRLLMGRLLGPVPLGIFNVAFRLIAVPLEVTTNVTNSVMFPALSGLQDDRQAVGQIYLRSTRMIALLTFPMMIGFAALAEPAVLFVLGERWRASVPLIQLLALSGLAQSVYQTAWWLYLSQGRTDISLRISAYVAAVRAGGAAIGINWGVGGVALAHVVGTLVLISYPVWRSAGRLVRLRFGELVRNLEGPFFCAAAMGVVVAASDHWLSGHATPAFRTVAGMVVGAVVYGILVQQFRLQAWSDLRYVVLKVFGQSFPILVKPTGGKPLSGSEAE